MIPKLLRPQILFERAQARRQVFLAIATAFVIGWGAIITIVPMLLVGLFARIVFKMNFVTLTGLISGAMTSSPTLLFANETTESSAPAVAYAAVYPLSMLIPVFCSQLLVSLIMR